MERVVGDLDYAIANLDDVIIFSKIDEEHINHIDRVFDRMQQANLKLKYAKCEFFR